VKPLSKEAVKRLALSHGGKLDVGGKSVNSARLQVVGSAPAPKPESKSAYMPNNPEPAPAQTIEHKPNPEFREAVLSIENFAASQFLLNDQNVQTMNAIKEVLNKPVGDKRPTQWVFKVKRDAHGLMETITATAKFQE
jgi:hypothetical protein